MDYIKIRFSKKIRSLYPKQDRSIEDVFRSLNPMFCADERAWTPQADIYETPDDVIIRVEIAGVDKENLEVEISTRAVKIQGRRFELPRIENATYRLAEIQYGRFERILYLPVPIDPEIVSTSYFNGFLEIRLAKQKLDKSYKIPISDGM